MPKMAVHSARDQTNIRDLVVAIFRANGALIANGNRLVADLGLTAALWQVLDALERADGQATVAEIGRMMGLTRQSVQRSVDRLADRGLAIGLDNPAHKRAPLIALTQEGRSILQSIHVRELVSRKKVLACLEPTEAARATQLVVAFAQELERQAQDGGTPKVVPSMAGKRDPS